jgi:sulfoxide reductase heme-binding subunit YedZ
MASSARRRRAAAKVAVWASALTPAAWLAWRATHGQLGANPIEEVLHRTGWWGLLLLTTTLAITPVRRLSGWQTILRYRRLVGLFAFFYGFSAWLLLLTLAATSTRGWVRRLGVRWQRLHRLIYLASSLGVLHFYWKVKADTREPLIFGAVIGLLLLVRVPAVQRLVSR